MNDAPTAVAILTSATIKTSAVITVENVVGINETDISSISLYPNPAGDYVYLKLNNYPGRNVVITDATGQIVLQQNVTEENDGCKILIHDLPVGLYFKRKFGKPKPDT